MADNRVPGDLGDATDGDDPVTNREELELDLMEKDESELGEVLGNEIE